MITRPDNLNRQLVMTHNAKSIFGKPTSKTVIKLLERHDNNDVGEQEIVNALRSHNHKLNDKILSVFYGPNDVPIVVLSEFDFSLTSISTLKEWLDNLTV